MYFKWLTIISLVCSLSVAQANSVAKVGDGVSDKLPIKLLQAAAHHAGFSLTFPYQNKVNSAAIPSFSKRLNDLEAGATDVLWAQSNAQLEQKFNPIYIPIYRGLLGMRVASVRHDKSDIFNSIESIQDLISSGLSAGQGRGWSDSDILAANGLDVTLSNKYINLFPMLEGGRFDYFPRAIHEPWSEIETHKQYQLTVEPNILLQYTAPLYFFVAKDNKKLHQQLTQALEHMVSSGEYLKLFFADSEVRQALENANLANRKVIKLNNPHLSVQTPLEREELWFNPLSTNKISYLNSMSDQTASSTQ